MRSRSKGVVVVGILLAGASVTPAGVAHAQATPGGLPDLVQEYVPPETQGETADGWKLRLALGATLNLADSRNVVGQPDGSTWALGGSLEASAGWRGGKHELRNTLSLNEGFTRTPIIDEFVKSRDVLLAESLYLYHLLDWFGFFARAAVETAVFAGFDVRPAAVAYVVDGALPGVTNDRLRLTDPFEPLTLKESIGAFARPYIRDPLGIETRLGLGARQTFAEGGLAVTDDAATVDQIEVTSLSDFVQGGVESVTTVSGTFEEGKVTYKLSAEFMIPIIHTNLPPGDDRDALELTNIDLGAVVSFKLLRFMSLDYELRAIRQPQLIDEFQVRNNLLLTFTFELVHPPPPPPAPAQAAAPAA